MNKVIFALVVCLYSAAALAGSCDNKDSQESCDLCCFTNNTNSKDVNKAGTYADTNTPKCTCNK